MSTAATPAPAATPPPVTFSLDEFSDKLSPMLVKELRQGLRAKTFVILFLALQGLLAVVLLTAIGATSRSGDGGQTVSEVIFFFFALAALIAQPLRGVGALHNEIKGDTIDLMVLTRLGAWRIVLGKWVAIVSQTALLLTAIAPYLILRYFFGRMNLFAELNLLAMIFLGSAVFTAITVGLSAVPSILVRGLLPLFFAVYLGAGIFALTFDDGVEDLIKFCSLQADGSGWALLTGIAAGAYFGWFALALGASMIAPMAENHSSSRRLVALAAVAILGVIVHFADLPREATAALLVVIGTPAVMIALTEPLQLLPPICRPFLRFGTAGRVAGRFLYPGWPAGVLFTGLLIAAAVGVFFSRPVPVRSYGMAFNAPMQVMLLSGIGTLILAGLILRLFSKKVRQPFAFYLLIVVALVAVGIAMTLIAQETRDDGYLWFFAWLPPVLGPLMEWVSTDYYQSAGTGRRSGSPDYSPLIQTGIATTAAYYAALLICAFKSFPAIREVENDVPSKTSEEP